MSKPAVVIETPTDFAARFDVSRETLAQLQTLADMLVRWSARINLVGRTTLDQIWQRHIADSAQLWQAAAPELRPDSHWLDLGAGAGFPGLVIAALAAQYHTRVRITLIESDQRKSAFLLSCAQAMGLKPAILAQRIEHAPPQSADIISARALAPLVDLLPLASLHAASGAICLFPKGAQHDSELTAARRHWHIEADQIPSLTDTGAVILKIRKFSRAP